MIAADEERDDMVYLNLGGVAYKGSLPRKSRRKPEEELD